MPSNNFSSVGGKIAWSDAEEVSLEEVGTNGVPVGKVSLDEWDVITLS